MDEFLNPDELPSSERKAALGMVYLRAVAAVAGYSIAVPSPDMDSVDAMVRSRQGKRHSLDFQVKCTSTQLEKTPEFPFRLSLKNYDDLRVDSIIPRYLLVTVVPTRPSQWLQLNEKRLHLRRCGYWKSLHREPRKNNARTVTIQVPRMNVLTPSVLQKLMVEGGPR